MPPYRIRLRPAQAASAAKCLPAFHADPEARRLPKDRLSAIIGATAGAINRSQSPAVGFRGKNRLTAPGAVIRSAPCMNLKSKGDEHG